MESRTRNVDGLNDVVEMVELPGKEDGHDEHGDGLGGVDVDEVGVIRPDGQDHSDQGTKGVGGQKERHDDRLELGGGRAEGKLKTGGRCENLRDTDQDVGGHLGPDRDVVDDFGDIRGNGDGVALGVIARKVVVWGRLVEEVLQDCDVNEAEGDNAESNDDTVDGSQLEAGLAEQREDDDVEDGDEDDNDSRVDKGQLLGFQPAGAGHVDGHVDKVVVHVVIQSPVHGVDHEDLAGVESTLQIVDKLVVPLERAVVGSGSSLNPVGTSNTIRTVLEGINEAAEGLAEDVALGRAIIVLRATEGKDDDTDNKDNGRDHEGEIPGLLGDGGGDGLTQHTTNVDGHVEVAEDTLNGDGMVDGDAGLGGVGVILGGDLLGGKSRDVGLDTTSTPGDHTVKGNEETGETEGILEAVDGGDSEEDETSGVEDGKDQDGLELSEPLIGNDGTKDGGNV